MDINYNERLEKLIAQAEVDVVALVPGANMVYFTGLYYHLSERPTIALLSKDGLAVITPELEAIKLAQRPDLDAKQFMWSDSQGFQRAFGQAVQALGLSGPARLGVDGQTMRVFEWLAFAHAGADIGRAQDVGQDLLWLRAIKTQAEIDAMREAIEISEAALRRTMEWVQPGMSEQQIAAHLNTVLNQLGTDGYAFATTVLSGPKSALPHGKTGSRQLAADEFLLIDFGGKSGDYPADITRTFCLGTPSDEMRTIYAAVLRANEAARAAAKPGVLCSTVDKAARDVIEAAGYGPYFTHRTGHGLGLQGHELPNIASNSDVTLKAGMVFTVEPGIYIPEIGGVRIEDDVVVTADGSETLTQYPRTL